MHRTGFYHRKYNRGCFKHHAGPPHQTGKIMMARTKRMIRPIPARVIISGAALMLLTFMGMFAGVLAPHDPVLLDLKNSLAGMSFDYPFGTDELGRCIFSRCLYAMRATFGAALFISAMTIVVGCVIGVVSAYCGGFMDQLVRTVSDALLAIPSMIFVIIVVGFLGPGTENIVIAMLLAYWVWYARVARGLALRIKEYEYIRAARLCGTGAPGIIFRHIVPGMFTQMITQFTLLVGGTALGLAGYSFLGLGVQPPETELGLMISEGCDLIQTNIMIILWPSIFLVCFVLCLNIIGDYLSDYWRTRQ
jgi:nickel transport system permease protein